MIPSTQVLSVILLLAAAGGCCCRAFTTSPGGGGGLQCHRPQRGEPPRQQQRATTTALFGKGRRGRLAGNVSLDDEGNVKNVVTNKQKQRIASSRSKKRGGKGNGEGGGDGGAATAISPLLAEWAKEEEEELPSASAKAPLTKAASASAADVFVPFDDDDESGGGSSGSGKKKRKGKNKSDKKLARATMSAAQSAQMDDLLDKIDDTLQTTNCDVPELVSYIASLVDLPSSSTTTTTNNNNNDRVLLPTLKSILSSKPGNDEKRPAYRLAWAGSDDAICRVGTSLHKVPLARLQEIYVLLGYNKWELLEVIRILGPFPNVRNTLKGEIKLKKKLNNNDSIMVGNREGVRMEVSYNSMIDGTGKEILAGKEDNVKLVELDVWHASDRAIVCTTVPEGEVAGGDPLGGNGANVLFFAVEEDVDGELEKLRAA